MTKDDMKKALANCVCTVVFEKVNGEERTMHCTTNVDFIPKDKHPKSSVNGREDVIAAFDTSKQDWRSFRVDSVREFKV